MDLMRELLGEEERIIEGRIPVEIGMTLDRVIASGGKQVDGVALAVLSGLAQAFRDGDLSLLTTFTSNNPSTELVDHIRNLKDEDALKLATALRLLLDSKDAVNELGVFNPLKSTTDWIKFVVAKQD